MTIRELYIALQVAPSDAERARIYEATTEEEREELGALIGYEEMYSDAPREALQAQLEACGDNAFRADAVLAAADPDVVGQLQLHLTMAGMNTAKSAEFYLHMLDTPA